MEEEELIEALANRLYAVCHWEQEALMRSDLEGIRQDRTACRRVARECLRLMKWAKEEAILWCEDQESYSWGRPGNEDTDRGGNPLPTLPPPDWEP